MVVKNWVQDAAKEIAAIWPTRGGRDDYLTEEQRANVAVNLESIIQKHCPFEEGVVYTPVLSPEKRAVLGEDDFDLAIKGDEHAQLRTVVRALANQMMLLCSFKEVPVTMRVSSKNLAKAAVDLLEGD